MDIKYDKQELEWSECITDENKKKYSQNWLRKDTLDYWRHQRMLFTQAKKQYSKYCGDSTGLTKTWMHVHSILLAPTTFGHALPTRSHETILSDF